MLNAKAIAATTIAALLIEAEAAPDRETAEAVGVLLAVRLEQAGVLRVMPNPSDPVGPTREPPAVTRDELGVVTIHPERMDVGTEYGFEFEGVYVTAIKTPYGSVEFYHDE